MERQNRPGTDATKIENALNHYSALVAELALTDERATPRPAYKAIEYYHGVARCHLFALAGNPQTEGAFFDALEAYTACVEKIAKTPAGSVPKGTQQRLQTTRRRVLALLYTA